LLHVRPRYMFPRCNRLDQEAVVLGQSAI
jgi:hypothetical protein